MIEITDDAITGGVRVLRLAGRLDLVSASAVRAAIAAEVRAGHPRLIIDLSAVPFIDSTGIGALIGGLRVAREAGGELRIAGAGEQVRTVLRLTTVDRIIRPYTDVGEATAGL